ncbi:MAG TPA: DUF3152 domain-containing protein [Catenuloplanes sp.]
MLAAGAALFAIAALTVAIGLPQLADGNPGGVPFGGAAVPIGDREPAADRDAAADREAVAQAPTGGPPPGEPGAPTPGGDRQVLRLPGPVPQEGTGQFRFAAGGGPLLGRSGTVLRFRVAVEDGSQEDLDPVISLIDTTLGDPRSWTGDGRTRMRRVSEREPADFTIYLVTATLAGRMCLAGGVDITVDGRPYTSCRAPGKVILNLNRWRQSVPGYVDGGVPLQNYRQYVINHEVGHELGHGHEKCPGQGRPAPVMLQQTLDLRGCVANSWPRLDGRRYAGSTS